MTHLFARAVVLPFFLLSSVPLAHAQVDVDTTQDPLVSVGTIESASDDQFVQDEGIVIAAPDTTTSLLDDGTEANEGGTGLGVDITEITNADDASDSTSVGRVASAEAQKFRAQLNQHTIDVLKWQLQTSERILQLVMFMSFAGILFAGYQLWHSLNISTKRAAAAKGSNDGASSATASNTDSTISFGDGKFEVTSPIVGILILVISLGALYFFLDFVYTVKVVSVAAG